MLTGQTLGVRRGDAGKAVAIRDVDFSPAHSDKARFLLDMPAMRLAVLRCAVLPHMAAQADKLSHVLAIRAFCGGKAVVHGGQHVHAVCHCLCVATQSTYDQYTQTL